MKLADAGHPTTLGKRLASTWTDQLELQPPSKIQTISSIYVPEQPDDDEINLIKLKFVTPLTTTDPDDDNYTVLSTAMWSNTQVNALKIKISYGEEFSALCSNTDELPEAAKHFADSQVSAEVLRDSNFDFTNFLPPQVSPAEGRVWVKFAQLLRAPTPSQSRAESFMDKLLQLLGFDDYPYSIQHSRGVVSLGSVPVATEPGLQVHNMRDNKIVRILIEDQPVSVPVKLTSSSITPVVGEAMAMIQHQYLQRRAPSKDLQDQEFTGAVVRYHGISLSFAALTMKGSAVTAMRSGMLPTAESRLLTTSAKWVEQGSIALEKEQRGHAATRLYQFIKQYAN